MFDWVGVLSRRFFVEHASNNHKHTGFYENSCISSL